MRIIAVTTPKVIAQDADIIAALLRRGVDIIHLRKPDSDVNECRALLSRLDAEQRSRIVIHDYPELYDEFSLKGIHLNRNVASLPDGYTGFKTRSCHSVEELVRYKSGYDYLFLSPIFDSISKLGYGSKFSHDELLKASTEGIIDDRVVALGGVTPDRVAYLRDLGFGGIAMCGAIYHVGALDSSEYLY